MADTSDQRAAGLAHQLGEQRVARGTVGGLDAQFDQFVIGQGAPGFIEQAGREALLADVDHGLQAMRAAAQEAPLLVGQVHEVMISRPAQARCRRQAAVSL